MSLIKIGNVIINPADVVRAEWVTCGPRMRAHGPRAQAQQAQQAPGSLPPDKPERVLEVHTATGPTLALSGEAAERVWAALSAAASA